MTSPAPRRQVVVPSSRAAQPLCLSVGDILHGNTPTVEEVRDTGMFAKCSKP